MVKEINQTDILPEVSTRNQVWKFLHAVEKQRKVEMKPTKNEKLTTPKLQADVGTNEWSEFKRGLHWKKATLMLLFYIGCTKNLIMIRVYHSICSVCTY